MWSCQYAVSFLVSFGRKPVSNWVRFVGRTNCRFLLSGKLRSAASYTAEIIIPVTSFSSKHSFSSLSFWHNSPTRTRASSLLRFLDHTQRHATVAMTPLDEGSARRTDLYLTTHNTHTRQTLMPPAGFETAIAASGRLQILALDRSATGIGTHFT